MTQQPESAGAVPEWTVGWRMQRALAYAHVSVLCNTRDGNILLARDEMGHASVQTTELYTLANSSAAARAVNELPVPRSLRHARVTP